MGMRDLFERNPGLKYIFFGGKGGVGKTVMAGATAIYLARSGRRTLLASTNPVHSLSSLFGQDLFGEERAVEGVQKLWAYEIDTSETVERAKKEIKDKISWFLKFSDIPVQSDEFVDLATLNPAFEESAMFENMVDIMLADRYEVYVFDTAPTANARRLLGMSKVYALWVEKMLRSRKEAASLRKALSFRKGEEERDPLLEYLLSFRERIEKARGILTDPSKTAFIFVTLPEALPIAVIKRFISWFKDFGIPIGGVVVNGIIRESGGDEFVENRIAMQRERLEEIYRDLSPVLGEIPLYEKEVRGIEMLSIVAEDLFR
jgi:arsenite-transporting ATPase